VGAGLTGPLIHQDGAV